MSRITPSREPAELGSRHTTAVGSAVAGSLFQRAKVLFRQSEPESTAAASRKVASPHHAVSIVPGRHACPEAHALRERRFLSREAPALPLAGCAAGQCGCRYEHHADRRKGGRRARDLAVSIDGYEDEDRRDPSKRGRRKSDTKSETRSDSRPDAKTDAK